MTWDAIRLSRVTLALLIIVVMVGGILLGGAVTAIVTPNPTATPSASPSATSSPAVVPGVDVRGDEIPRLPRYPGSVRSDFEIDIDDRYRLTAVEYLTDATIDEVRLFYQNVIDAHGWEPADIQYKDGEWTYVLVDGRTEALIQLEITNGLVEIDLQISEPMNSPSPTPSPTPSPEPSRMPTATPPPTPGDDDDDDDDSFPDDSFDSDD